MLMTMISDSYAQVVIPLAGWEREILEGQLYSLGCLGLIENETAIVAYFSPEHAQTVTEFLTHLYRQNSRQVDFQLTISHAQDWATGWQNYFRPTRITDRIGIRPPWRRFRRNLPLEIVIQPGMAFGTGTHATTQLALKLLERYLKPGMRVLDAGCGSGVLSIAALRLGAQSVAAWDIDPEIRENFQENMHLNQLTSGWQLFIGDVLTLKNWDYDLILSNIEKQTNRLVLMQLVQSPGRPVGIFTGLLAKDTADFVELVLNYRREILAKRKKGEWLALAIQ